MANADFSLNSGRPLIVGSFGNAKDLREAVSSTIRDACDIAEIRLDLLADTSPQPEWWRHLLKIPLLFTARRSEEGGAGSYNATDRIRLLETALDDAACIDIEVASITEMPGLLETLRDRNIPWIASFHDFEKLPDSAVLADAARRAKDAGATVFKAAAMLHQPADLALLAEFQLADHGIPVATMGMGPLAPVSRLLCAQCGSLLNYGFLGTTATAPGQWDAAALKQSIAGLEALRA